VRRRQVDHDRVGRRVERRGVAVTDAEEDDVGACGSGFGVRDEVGQVAVEPRVERGGRAARERVRPERDRIQPWMGEQAVERLLAGVPGAPEDGSAEPGA
jgi:hypothetical protein